MLAGFELVMEQENVEEEKFQIADSISYLSALPEQETGTGVSLRVSMSAWLMRRLCLFLAACVRDAERESVLCAAMGLPHSVLSRGLHTLSTGFRGAVDCLQYVSCSDYLGSADCLGTVEDAKYVLHYLQSMEEKLDRTEFLMELNKNASYLKDLITSHS
jgi:hypothetical protein